MTPPEPLTAGMVDLDEIERVANERNEARRWLGDLSALLFIRIDDGAPARDVSPALCLAQVADEIRDAKEHREEIVRLRAVVAAARDMRAAWSEHVHRHGFEHENGCPEDDTCECPLVLAMSRTDAAIARLP